MDFLISADQFWNVANGEPRRGDVTINTRFGWTLSLAVENAHSVNLAVTHVLLVDSHRSQGDKELDDERNTFWAL